MCDAREKLRVQKVSERERKRETERKSFWKISKRQLNVQLLVINRANPLRRLKLKPNQTKHQHTDTHTQKQHGTASVKQ